MLDPFCGCGTTIVTAQKLNRKWIGIDVTHLAIGLIKYRLKAISPSLDIKVKGEPEDLAGAINLAKESKYELQWWAISKVEGQPYGDKKKGADTGIDGYRYFMDEKDKVKKAIISVKGGNTGVKDIRELIEVIGREESPIGTSHRKIQIITIQELLEGKRPDIPLPVSPFTVSKQDVSGSKRERLI